jgi:hypothetical protein
MHGGFRCVIKNDVIKHVLAKLTYFANAQMTSQLARWLSTSASSLSPGLALRKEKKNFM